MITKIKFVFFAFMAIISQAFDKVSTAMTPNFIHYSGQVGGGFNQAYDDTYIGGLDAFESPDIYDAFSEEGSPSRLKDKWIKLLNSKEVGTLASYYTMNGGSNPVGQTLRNLRSGEIGAMSEAQDTISTLINEGRKRVRQGDKTAANAVSKVTEGLIANKLNLAVSGIKADEASKKLATDQASVVADMMKMKLESGIDLYVINQGMINPSKMTTYTDFKLLPRLIKVIKEQIWLGRRFNFEEKTLKANALGEVDFSITTANTSVARWRRFRIEVTANSFSANQGLESSFEITFYDGLAQTTLTLPVWYFKYSEVNSSTVRFSTEIHLHNWDSNQKRLVPTYANFSDAYPVTCALRNLDPSATATLTIIGAENIAEGNY